MVGDLATLSVSTIDMKSQVAAEAVAGSRARGLATAQQPELVFVADEETGSRRAG